MALLDNFSNPFEGMNIFGARLPTYLSGIPASEGVDATKGLLNQAEIDKLKNQALFQGLLGTAATYLSQPKNQNYGSALPYLAKAYLGGMQGSQGAYDQATQNLLTKSKLAESQREAEAAATIKETQTNLMADKRVQDSPVLKALVAKGQFKDVADIISPKPTDDYDRYAFAYKEKPFKDLTAPEKQEIIKQVQKDKKDAAMQFNLGSPVAGLDASGQPVFFQPSKTGGVPSIVPNIRPIQEPKPPTEEQSKARTFFKRMEGSTKVFNQPAVDAQGKPIIGDDGNPLTIEQVAGKPEIGAEIAGALPVIGKVAKRGAESTNRQLYRQAQENWVTANLRKESGAVIGAEEMQKEIEKYFPQINEGPEVIAQKAESRRIAEEGMKSNANFPAEKTTEPAQKAQPKQTSAKGLKIGQVVNGFKYLGGDPNNQNSWSK
jgi:hypothetical protein